ncbi:MAG: hypothetical protein NPIRA02_12060 [Nitrospirales bacterium]|nr:MAG: hypothetical protein NPIRA02_12060 [Nitrospirales bacterium]
MKKTLAVMAICSILGSTSVPFVHSASNTFGSSLFSLGSNTLEGTLLTIEGNEYVIMDQEGDEQRIQVDGRTTITGNVQPGAKVKAEVTNEGHAAELEQVIEE